MSAVTSKKIDLVEPTEIPSELTTNREPVDAERANAYLRLNHPNNRKMRRDWVRQLANDMANGDWEETGDPIRFDINGHLIDGQHRLAAIVLSEVEVPLVIMRGVQPKAIHVIDTGRSRRPMDALKIAGYGNTALLAGAARILLRIKAGPLDGTGMYSASHSQLLDVVTRHPLMYESTKSIKAIRGIRPTLLVAMHYIGRVLLDKPERADAFLSVFTTGVPDYKNDPAHALRERWIQARGAKVRMTDQFTLLQIAHVWNHFAKSRQLTLLKFPGKVEIDGLNTKKV